MIYALSGIALNHLKQWNPNYQIKHQAFHLEKPLTQESITREAVQEILQRFGETEKLKKYYFPKPQHLKIFIQNGNIDLDLASGNGVYEKLNRRFLFFEINLLHYNPNRWWTWFSDIFAGGLILLAVSGLFLIKGKKGITGRGAWLTGLGILIPILFLWFFK